jgi:hypothetical protein
VGHVIWAGAIWRRFTPKEADAKTMREDGQRNISSRATSISMRNRTKKHVGTSKKIASNNATYGETGFTPFFCSLMFSYVHINALSSFFQRSCHCACGWLIAFEFTLDVIDMKALRLGAGPKSDISEPFESLVRAAWDQFLCVQGAPVGGRPRFGDFMVCNERMKQNIATEEKETHKPFRNATRVFENTQKN